jgi:hypothetical protein
MEKTANLRKMCKCAIVQVRKSAKLLLKKSKVPLDFHPHPATHVYW